MDPRASSIGSHVLLGELGRGGMGIVYKARAPDGRTVAIKLLHNKDPAALARFERERRLLAEIGRGFVPLLETGACPKGPYFVMPLVEGGTLRQRIERGPLNLDDVVALGRALAAALARAHAEGIVHRDLKPENVLFTAEGEPLVADLGLAKHWSGSDGATSARISLSGEFLGTAGYMSPEQMQSARDASPATDVFALGAILHECLTGRPAFVGATLVEVLAAVAAGSHDDLRATRPETPEWLVRVVDRALTGDPRKRYQDAAELGRALEGDGARRRRLLPAVLVFLAFAAAVFAFGRRGPAEAHDPVAPVVSAAVPKRLPLGRIPALCAGFTSTRLTTLTEVVNDYQGSHAWPIGALAVSHDGARLATGAGNVVTFWNLASHDLEELRTARTESGSVLSLAWSEDDSKVYAGTSDGLVYDVAPDTGAAVSWRGNMGGAIRSMDVSPNGLWVGAIDRRSSVVSLLSKDGLGNRDFRAPIRRVFVTKKGTQFVAVLEDGLVDFISLGAAAQSQFELGIGVDAIAFTKDGTFAAVAAADRYIYLVNVEHGASMKAFSRLASRASAMEVAPAGDVGYCAVGRRVKVLVIDGRKESPAFEVPGAVSAIAATPSGAVVVATRDGMAHVVDPRSGVLLHPRPAHASNVLALDATARGTLVSGSADQDIRLLDAERREQVLRAGAGAVNGVAISGDGQVLVSVHADGKLRNWDLGARDARSTKAIAGVRGVLLTQDGARAVTWGADEAPRLWDTATMKPLLSLEHGGPVSAAALSPSGARLVTAGEDGRFKLRNLADGQELGGARIEVPLTSCVFASEDEVLLGDDAGRLRSWSLAAGLEGARFEGHSRAVRALALTPDGARVLSASDDGTVRIWDRAGHSLDVIDLARSSDRGLAISCRDAHAFAVGTARGVVLRFELRD